tara:strand:- start:71 stop:943 length:873 start_codon:yes stop_codon:yes gene_type:complete
MNSYDETHLLMCEKEELVKYILELRDNDEEAMKLSMTQNEAFMDQLERKDSVIGDRNEEIENWHKENKNLKEELDEKDEELDEKDEDIHKLEEELDETVNVMEDITEHPDYEYLMNKYPYGLEEENNELKKESDTRKRLYLKSYHENEELKARIEYLERNDEEAMKLSMSQNERFMDQLEKLNNKNELFKENIIYKNEKISKMKEEISKKLESDKYQVHHINCYLDYNGKYLECPDKGFIDEYTDDEKLRKDLYEDFNITDDEEEDDEEDNIEDICKDIIKTIVEGVVGP